MMHWLITRALYPTLLIAAPLSAWLLLRAGVATFIATVGVVAPTALLVWLLERLAPYREDWQPRGATLKIDLLHTGLNAVLGRTLKLALVGLVAALATQLGGGLGLWPQSWPLGLQLLLAIPLADLPIYLAHRLMHVTELGWRIHAVHHTPKGLHLWAAARSHPFNVAIKILGESGLLLLLGIGAEAFSIWLVFMTVHGLIQHSNLPLKTPLLRHLLASPDVHRVHHAAEIRLSKSNYGNTTMLWDKLFGSYRAPDAEVEVGIDNYAIPERYPAHLLTPFVLNRWLSTPNAAEPPPRQGLSRLERVDLKTG